MRTFTLTLAMTLQATALAAQTVTLGGAEVTNVEWHDAPLARHRSIYKQVVRCLGVTDAPPAASVRWGVADAIVRRGRPLYGMALLKPRTVVVERAVRNHPSVLSHEIGHLFDLAEGDPELIRCAIPSTTGLPRRTS